MNDRDIPLQPKYSLFGLWYVYFSSALLAITFLPEVLQNSVVELATGSISNFFLMALAKFGSISPVAFILTLIFVALAIIYYAFDGKVYTQQLWQWCRPKVRVSPTDALYKDEDDNASADDSEHKNSNDVYEFTTDNTPYDRVVTENNRTMRAGLFDKQDRLRLKEGQWRVIKHRITKARALRSLMEMNRKFHIETPLDTEVLEYAQNLEVQSDGEDDQMVKVQGHSDGEHGPIVVMEAHSDVEDDQMMVIEPSPRKRAFQAFVNSPDRDKFLQWDEESPCVTPIQVERKKITIESSQSAPVSPIRLSILETSSSPAAASAHADSNSNTQEPTVINTVRRNFRNHLNSLDKSDMESEVKSSNRVGDDSILTD